MRWLLLVLLAACAGHGSSAADLCSELSLHDCRLTEGCKPDLCDTCICDIAYRGCLAINQTPEQCPQLGCPSGQCCTTANDCDASTPCVAPGTPLGCGACTTDPGDCTGDGECGGMICEPIECSCDGNFHCVAGCTSATCGEGTVCDTGGTNRCVAQPCGSSGPACPGNFECRNGSTCTRIQCSEDLECDGFCVLGQCFSGARGECRPPVA